MNVKALIIHLKRATDRQKQVEWIQEQCPVPAEVVDAIDGVKLDADTVKTVYNNSLHKPHYPFKLQAAEIACFLSHRKCWQTILEENLDAALILEDDVKLDCDIFYPAFELAIQNFTLDDYFRFPIKCREVAVATRSATSTHELIVPRVIGLGMQGQLVGQSAARTLLEKTHTFDRPVDTFLQMAWLTDVWPISVYPAGISETSAQLGGSLISKPKSWRETLRREILRPLYRRKLATLAMSNSPISEEGLQRMPNVSVFN